MQTKTSDIFVGELYDNFDNIDYIESFLKYKYDPYELLKFFELKGIDIENLSRW